MTHRELEQLAGQEIGPTILMFHLPPHTYRKLPDGTWEPYPPYPEPPEAQG